MTSNETIAVGLVGCGRISEVGYLPAMKQVPGVQLVAVADTDPARRHHVCSLAEDLGLPSPAVYTDVDSLLDGTPIDAVILAIPPGSRGSALSAVSRAGAAVLVEKPPALDTAGAAELVALARPPWVGFNRRFGDGIDELARAIGAEQEVDLRLHIGYRRAAWGAYTARDDALVDLGPHLIDLARWLTGEEVIEVHTRALGTERIRLDLTLERSTAAITAATDRIHREYFGARTRSGSVERIRAGGVSAGILNRLGFGRSSSPLVESIAAQLEEFAEAVRGRTPRRLATARDGWAVMAVVDAARLSASAGEPVPVARVPVADL